MSLMMKPQSHRLMMRDKGRVNVVCIITVGNAFFGAIRDDRLEALFQLAQRNQMLLSAAADIVILCFCDCIFNLTLLLLQQDLLWFVFRATNNELFSIFFCFVCGIIKRANTRQGKFFFESRRVSWRKMQILEDPK
jgi:hypothetical protein